MERFYREPHSERTQWIALSVLDDWGGDWMRGALEVLLEQNGIRIESSPDEPETRLDRSDLNKLAGF